MTAATSDNARLYSFPDAELLGHARRAWQHATTQQPRLAAAAPALTPQWLADMAHELQAAEAPVGARYQSGVEGAEPHCSLRQARAALQDLFFYVHKAYQPLSDDAKVVFGTELYHDAAYHAGRMQALLTQAFHAAGASAHRTALAAAGYQDSALAELGALAEGLAATRTTPALAETAVQATEQARLLNALWQRCCLLQAAAEQAFAHEPALREPFGMQASAAGGMEKAEQ